MTEFFAVCDHEHNFGHGQILQCERIKGHEGDCIVRVHAAPFKSQHWMVSKGGYTVHPPFRVLKLKHMTGEMAS